MTTCRIMSSKLALLLFSFPFFIFCESENLSHSGCGLIPASSTIINGSPATFPWMVFLFSSPENGDPTGFCGGSLISDLQILTAAHCVAGKTTNDVAVILADKSPLEKLNKFDFRYLFKIEMFPAYNQHVEQGFKYNSDIAILTLEEPVLLTSRINPICLPPLSSSDQSYEGMMATVAGWGTTETGKTSIDQLMSVDLPVISNKKCRTFYKWIKRYAFNLKVPHEIHTSTCKHDSHIMQLSHLRTQDRIRSLSRRLWWTSHYYKSRQQVYVY